MSGKKRRRRKVSATSSQPNRRSRRRRKRKSSASQARSSSQSSVRRRRKRKVQPSTARKRSRKRTVQPPLSSSPLLEEKKDSSLGSIALIFSMIVLLLFTLVIYIKIDRAEIVSGSMEPTLKTDDRVIIINDKAPKRFDLVVFRPPGNPKERYVKRLIGLPGDEMYYSDDVLYVNNQFYQEDYLDGYKVKYRLAQSDENGFANYTEDFKVEDIPGVPPGTEKIPEGMYLMLGDNRQNSQDSRYIGLIPQENIEGVIWKRYYRAED